MNMIKIKKLFRQKRNLEVVKRSGFISASAVVKKITAIALIALMTGCEAQLNLGGINEVLLSPVRRADQFQAVAANDTTVLAVGNDGLVVSSSKRNIKWNRQQIEGNPSFIDIARCPDQSFALLSTDGRVWLSNDNGSSWTVSNTDTSESVLSLVCSPDNGLWITASFSTIISSDDKGENWKKYSLNEDSQLTSLQFLSASDVIVAGEFGLIAKSHDKGLTWVRAPSIPNDFYPQDIFFLDSNRGWVAGLGGQILYTDDGGGKWQQQKTSTQSPLYSFSRLGNNLLVLGDHGHVLKLEPSKGWEAVGVAKRPVYLRGGVAINDNHMLIAGGWGSLFSLDIQ